MAAGAQLTIRPEYVDHDHDHWCNTCRLATGVRFFIGVTAAGQASLRVVLYCVLCRGGNITVNPDARHC